MLNREVDDGIEDIGPCSGWFDGLVDESQFNGEDDDGDWDIEKDDLGSDGIGPEHPNYIEPDPDGTEGNGQPDVAGWIEFLTESQGITREVYVRDEVWPSVALKKLAGQGVKVTPEDLKRGYEANYGPKIRCRAIVLNNQRRAQEVWEKARELQSLENFEQTLDKFGDLAEQYSIEAGSRSLRGEVPPIQKNGGQPILEKEAFSLKPGELSGIVQAGDKYIILLCEAYTKPIDTSFEEVEDLLYRDIHEKKQRIAMAKLFDLLKDNARIDNFLSGTSKVPRREEQRINEDLGLPRAKVRP